LETDPEAKSIDLTNPVVKPEHLDAIAKMARKESLLEISNADDTSYTEAAKYLNWPLLEMAAKSSEYTDLLEFCPYLNIYLPETYGSALCWTIIHWHQWIVRHILQVTDSTPMDGHALILAVMTCQVDVAKLLLPRVDPATVSVSD